MPATPYAIEFQEVSLAFGERVILDRVSFSVRYGESKIVMGGSGFTQTFGDTEVAQAGDAPLWDIELA